MEKIAKYSTWYDKDGKPHSYGMRPGSGPYGTPPPEGYVGSGKWNDPITEGQTKEDYDKDRRRKDRRKKIKESIGNLGQAFQGVGQAVMGRSTPKPKAKAKAVSPAAQMGAKAKEHMKALKPGLKKESSLRDRFIKEAAPSFAQGAMRRGKQWMPFVLASVAAGALLQGVQIFIDKLVDVIEEHGHKAKSKDYYKKMLDAHPSLTKQDPRTVAKYWDSLYHFAPSMAEDPLAAGAYIRQSLDRGLEDLGGPSPDIVQNLTGIDAALTKTKEIKKPGKKFMDVTQLYPAKEVGLELVKEDIKNNPNDWGIN